VYGRPLLPDLQHHLAARVPTRDPSQCLASVIQRLHRLDLGTQFACIDEPREFLQPLPAAVGRERFAGYATLQLGRST
jgi:hypothetical protein